jgi:hypothetical protein
MVSKPLVEKQNLADRPNRNLLLPLPEVNSLLLGL